MSKLENPEKWDQCEDSLLPLVKCSLAPSLRRACDLLFIHSHDLAFGEPKWGTFFVRARLGPDFQAAKDVAASRSQLGVRGVARYFYEWFMRRVVEAMAAAGPDVAADPGKAQAVMIQMVMAEVQNGTPEYLLQALPRLGGSLAFSVDLVAGTLVEQLLELRQRHLATTSLAGEDYDALVGVLEQSGIVQPPFLRIEFPSNLQGPRLTISASGISAPAAPGSHTFDVYRLGGDLGRLKNNSDHALAVFIATYLNQCSWHPQCAFSGAKYGEGELDVVIPRLGVGVEVKLYQAPLAVTPNKLRSYSAQVAKQLQTYFKNGCQQVVVVTNLPAREASGLESVLRKRNLGLITVVAGCSSVIVWMKSILQQLDACRNEDIATELKARWKKSREQTELNSEMGGEET